MPGIALFFFFFCILYFEPGADKLRRELGACMSGWHAGGDGRLLSDDRRGCHGNKKVCLPPLLYAGGLPFSLCRFQWRSTVALSSSGSSSATQVTCFLFVLYHNTALQWKSYNGCSH